MVPLKLNKVFASYLIFTVFLVGAVVMLIEILAARIIAPYFGSSIFVWTAVISITLLSLALGYFLGGKIADRVFTAGSLYASIALCGAYLFLVLLIKKPTLAFSAGLGLRQGALIASTALFALPLFLLGMVTPLAVKLYTKRMESLGSHVGALYFFSTLGSFLGTLVSGYILIPVFGVSRILIFCADSLIVISLIYFILFSRNLKSLLLMAVLPLNLSLMNYDKLSTMVIKGISCQELYKSDSSYGRLKIIDVDNKVRYLVMDGINQGGLNTLSGLSEDPYSYIVEALSVMACPEIKRALVVGLGPGIVPNTLSKRGVVTDVVEIDPAITALYEKFFAPYGLRDNITIFTEDGRSFINRNPAQYDIVILDVFLGDNAPWHLLTRETFLEIKGLLTERGALVVNFIGLPQEPAGARIIGAIHKTLAGVFTHAYTFNSSRPMAEGARNIYFLASLKEPASDFPAELILPERYDSEVRETIKDRRVLSAEGDAFILTDEYNPIDFYTASSKESLRKLIMSAPEGSLMLD